MFPWWAIALLPLRPDTPEWRVRRAMQAGRDTRVARNDRASEIWSSLVDKAEQLRAKKDIDAWRQKAFGEREGGPIATAVRDAALYSERAFVQFANLCDDEGVLIELAPFHIRVIRGMRQEHPACIVMPLEHGKSWLSTILVSLMDWAEWENASECRIYWNDTHVTKWLLKLQDQVEFNRELQHCFPWIRRPQPGDRSRQWSTDGFSIGGRTLPDRSFEPLGARSYSTGNRYSGRVGCDDWVNRGNCASATEQLKLKEYFFSGPMTMTQKVRRQSKYGTKWATCFLDGTFFDRRDVNYKTFYEFKNLGYVALRFDVFPNGRRSISRKEVLWPAERDFDYIMRKRKEMGERIFNMRMRNLVVDEGMETFAEDRVLAACMDIYQFGKIPEQSYSAIGFDPASGSTSRFSADPAIALYSEVPDLPDERELGPLASIERHEEERTEQSFTAHFVQWKRLTGYDFPKQCQEIVQWARWFNLPVIIEKNATQRAYKDYLKRIAPDVRVYNHHTGANRDDPDSGVETFSPLLENDRMVIHAGHAPRDELEALTTQLIEWPQSDKKDLLMAFWFARLFCIKRHHRRQFRTTMRTDLPSYLDGIGDYWNHYPKSYWEHTA